VLKGSERGVIDNEDLDACATRASEALIKFLKQEETCDEEGDKDDGEELDAAKIKKKMKDLGDLIGASASLCGAIRILVDLQVRLDVDVTTRNPTFAWETAAREKQREIDGKMLDLNNTGNWKTPSPRVTRVETPATGSGPGILELGVSDRQGCMFSIPRLVT
jgi:hypothetical protein